jgi:bifunctional UDP-N-acetylglucosamine pyrophosphorylase/glucosamine-1-phosphate N-acetyltransferase
MSPSKKSSPTKSTNLNGFAIAILAAGKGTRLKSRHPKVLHEIGGRPLLEHVITAALKIVPAKSVFAIIGYEAGRVRQAVAPTGVNFVLQEEQNGTGHALICAQPQLEKFKQVLVLSGDVPLILPETLRHLAEFHLRNRAAMSILTARPADPHGYGRIVRSRGNQVGAIVEQSALNKKQSAIGEINSGIYVFNAAELFEQLPKLRRENFHRELYLTDVAALLVKARQRVLALEAAHADEVLGVNTRAELARLDSLLRQKKAAELMASGVTIFRPETCMIDSQVQVGVDTVLAPFVQLLGKTHVGNDCRIGSFSIIRDSELRDGVEVRSGCVITESQIHSGAILGPYAHLRPGSEIGEGAHVGNFVETKKARLGRGAKANHLTYLGDAEVGANVNVGAGTITCNYDGVNKHRTVIEEGAFIGSDATLVAPVRVGAGAYIGAASCITEDVPAGALGIARNFQTNKEGWARKRREPHRGTSSRANTASAADPAAAGQKS